MDIKDVESLAALARLDLSEEEKKGLLSDMKGILDYVKTIESIEIEDTGARDTLRNVWREDVLEPRDFSRDLILEQFPDSQDGFLKVKKIL